jgi:hypothetical protein
MDEIKDPEEWGRRIMPQIAVVRSIGKTLFRNLCTCRDSDNLNEKVFYKFMKDRTRIQTELAVC